jgi:hypothetical protein
LKVVRLPSVVTCCNVLSRVALLQQGKEREGKQHKAAGAEEQMEVALLVLARMKAEKLRVDQAVYRALIEACGRARCHQQE